MFLENIAFKTFYLYLAAASVIIIHHVFIYTGHYGYDDLHYAKLANELLSGRMDFEDHYSFRWPILVFTAISFKLFGINDFAGALPTLIISLLTLYLVYIILKPFGAKAILFGLGITVFDGWSLHYSDKMMPDMYINLVMLSLVYCFYHLNFLRNNTSAIYHSFYFSILFFFGFLAKESILLVLPLIFYWFITDIYFKRNITFWKYTSLFSCMITLLYFVGIHYLTGSAT